ncbi:MAG: hypothetical protein BroJett040_10160 [Oligoflexia bacterium]|nr:MAG: hypothetical protein BroJett040_10160 [Oligoflexia bacterium]
MTSRNRPVSGPNANATNTATEKASEELNRLVRDEMSDIVSGFVNPPSENSNETRSIAGMKLHSILKSLMEKNGESARSAAKACQIPLSTFTGYLKPDKKQIDPGHLLAIAKHYGVSLDYLFGYQQSTKFDKLPTKKLFSKWVKLTIEDIADADETTDDPKGSSK